MHKVNIEKIKQLRKQKKLSQSEMAKVLGFNSLYPYQRKETGTQSFTAEELHTIASYFNHPIEYFFESEVAESATGRSSA
ncbi:helix-turn-helix transcriptional regulator [Evansella tamaricis]|uniref:Helix-turn-helix domain-containing protein n=1 Tax=Evansella tamaricis TaxID=2069301 RepID=A0ABS6JC17_9BACI|nr:helix-turn-helix transcriptional regulator [Evansella tamaricis]MBU9711116.1 helix-turn-helix domain-containing protein [Evansella tamaricis]